MKSNKLFHTVMKVKNIIYIISLVFAAMSCSMDSDTMMNDTTKEIENSLNNGEVAVSFSLADGSVATKSVVSAADDNTTDQDINNVTVFLLEGENVIDVKQPSVGDYQNCFYVKKGERSNLRLIVVANSSIGTSFTTADGIRTAAIHLDDCTKFGEKDLTPTENGYTATVELTQSYAGIELGKFNVVKGEGIKDGVQVSLTGVELLNQNTVGQVNGALAGVNLTNKSWDFGSTYPTCKTSSNSTDILNGHNVFLRTFAYNYSTAGSEQLALRLTYKIGDKDYSKTITVQGKSENQLEVEAGCIYQVNVTLNVSTKEVTISNLKWVVQGFDKKENINIEFN